MSYATPELLARARDLEQPDPILLVAVTFFTPGQRTVRFATKQTNAGTTYVWQPLITNEEPVAAIASALDGGPNYAEFGFTLANEKVAYQADPEATLTDSLSEYEWQGAQVTAYRYFEGLSSAQAQPVFVGEIIAIYGDEKETRFKCRQAAVEAAVPNVQITKGSHPSAPSASLEKWIPVLIGSKAGPPYRSPISTPYGSRRAALDSVGAASLLVPGILTNTGRTGGRVEVVYASHALAAFDDDTIGCDVFIRGQDTVASMDYTGTKTNDASGAKIAFDLATLFARIGVIPIDVRVPQSTADNGLNAIDMSNPETFATLNEAAGKGILQLILPSPGALGKADAVDLVVCYSTMPATGALSVGPKNPGNTTGGTPLALANTTGLDDVAVAIGAYDSAWWKPSEWSFGGVDAPRDIADLKFYFASASAQNIARVFWVALRPHYQPSRNVVIPGRDSVQGTVRLDVQGRKPSGRSSQIIYGALPMTAYPATEELVTDFFYNGKGWFDDAVGTFTGTANALIERVPDAAALLLIQYGNASGLETTPGEFGSFVDARNEFVTIDGFPITVGRSLFEKGTVEDAVSSLMQDTGGFWFRNRFNGRHSIVRWTKDPAVTYARKLKRGDLLDDKLTWNRRSEVHLVGGASLQYGYDAFTGRYAFNAIIAPDRSAGGYDQFDQRDQYMTVVTNVNDKIDWQEETFTPVLFGGTAGNNRIQVASSASYATGMTVIDPYPVPIFIPAGTTIVGIPDATHVDLSSNLLNTVAFGASFCTIARRRSATLTAGDYNGPSLMVEARARMKAVSGSADIKVEYGYTVVAGVNDNWPIEFSAPSAGTTYWKVPAGFYKSAEAMVAAIFADTGPFSLATFLAAVGKTLTITHSKTTRKMTFAISVGSIRFPWTTPSAGSYDPEKSCAALFGFDPSAATALASSLTSDAEVRGETFRFARAGAFALTPATGPNASTSAHGLFGFLGVTDTSGAKIYCADFRRGYRERQIAAGPAGARGLPPKTITLPWINDARAATDLRDLMISHEAEAPIQIRFATSQMPDLERGMVFESDEDLDTLLKFPRFGSDGTWANKTWRTLEVRDHVSMNFQEIVAEEAGTAGAFEVPATPPTPTATPFFVAWETFQTSNTQVRLKGLFGDGTDAIPEMQVSSSTGAGAVDLDIAPDGAGGFFIAWLDRRGTTRKDVYCTRVDGSGSVHAGWPVTGVAVGANTIGDKAVPKVKADGTGGAIVAWTQANAGGGVGCYAQRLNGSGAVQWAANGVAAYSTAGETTNSISLVPDGTGAVTLSISTAATLASKALNIKLTSAGAVSWTLTILSGSNTATIQVDGSIEDGAGGTIVAFTSNAVCYLQRITGAGAIASGWGATGTNTSGGFTRLGATRTALVADGAGGAMLFWIDNRSSTYAIYGNRVNGSGAVQWAASGLSVVALGLASAGYVASGLVAIADGSGGAFLAISAQGAIYVSADIVVQRVTSAGAKLWGSAGAQITNSANSQGGPQIARDGLGGLWIAWNDQRPSGFFDIYAQRVDSSGTPTLAANGIAVTAASNHQDTVRACGP